jgi:hypothetical protein
MNDKKGNKYNAEKRHLTQRLSEDVHVILSACIHQFEDEKELVEECFDVDAIVAGRLYAQAKPKARHTDGKDAAHRSAFKVDKTPIRRGLFIPHQNLFDNVVRAHALA